VSEDRTRDLEGERQLLLARYDHGALPLAIWRRIYEIETELAWARHRETSVARASR
jgi:hypothetical protein